MFDLDLIQRFGFELTIGAFGYLLRKWYGEELEKYIFAPLKKRLRKYVLNPSSLSMKKFFIKTHREAAIWLHYRNKAHNKGHQHKNPIICDDDRCKLI